MQLAMLAPYNNLASSVAAALVPTMLGPKIKVAEDVEQQSGGDVGPNQSVKGRSTTSGERNIFFK